ncbi:hypothetical protein [uncultured virus]|uniref:Uncharacterized protein n=1 Tax=uncultured virus TaxID=340016 RepID=A0A5Q0TWT0_9VIRU|nr:hypothetical protein [uncultured virus]
MPFKRIRKILKPVLPIAGALLGGWVGGKIGGMLGGALGKNVGRVVGGIAGGLLGGGGKALGLQDRYSTQVIIPPYAQQGAQILENLLSQSSRFAQTIADIKRPYLEQAKASFKSLQSEIPNLFSRTRSEVSNLYEDLLSRTRDMITSEQAKQNVKLSALGLLNTQAQQWTTADILNRTAFPILQEKTKALAGLTTAEADTMLKYLFMKPDFYTRFADEMVATDPFLLEQQYKMDIAKAMMGVPTIVDSVYKRGLIRDLLPIVGLAGIELLKYRLLK